jgi:hypothetical protein
LMAAWSPKPDANEGEPFGVALDHHGWGLSLASALPRGCDRGIKPFLTPVLLAANPHA